MAETSQPGGRAPAPEPLDLVQDFVNTEVPDWHRDDLSTPAALAAWLRARGLIRAGDVVDGEAFVAARALRAALRELALANTVGQAPSQERRAAIDAALGAFPLVVRVGGDGRRATSRAPRRSASSTSSTSGCARRRRRASRTCPAGRP
jgi:hypothetical protein